METPRPVFSVSEFIEFINLAFKKAQAFRVRGEIANVKMSPSGHAYFDLKDSDTGKHLIQCWVWKFRLAKYKHLLENGFEVMLTGEPKLWEGGKFSFIADAVEPIGEGALRKAFEELKKTLSAKGYFSPERKRGIPEFVKNIGLVTSLHGAVIEDFRRNLGAHGFRVFVADARVEGDEAESSLISALQNLNLRVPDLDVIVLIRGGGSFESFAAFNSEVLAEAIVASRTPVITGIGHETDETIAGMVSDRDFSTPTAVAKFLSEAYQELLTRVDRLAARGEGAYDAILSDLRARIREKGNYLSLGVSRVFEAFSRVVERLSRAGDFYSRTAQAFLQTIEATGKSLEFLNPEGILEKGYALVYNEKSSVVREAKDVGIGEKISIRVRKGKIHSRVEEIEK
jgi:exodeoxyribonuclease VII large subunit